MSIKASVVVGVRLSEIYSTALVEGQVTRYHEETGQPYQKEVCRQVHRLFGVEVPAVTVQDHPAEWRYFRAQAPMVHVTIPGCPADEVIVGIAVAKMDDLECTGAVAVVPDLTAAFDGIEEWLKCVAEELGGKFTGVVNTYLVGYSS